jgi:hypothetical protein
MYYAEADWKLGKDVKRLRVNPTGEDAYLAPDGTVTFDEAKIVRVQQIFKHNYYKPEGKWPSKFLSKYKNNDKNTNMGNL